jgi:hypothetical protein
MVEQPEGVLKDVTDLPPVGTPERLDWDRTIREVNELYPDWSSIKVGKTCFSREAYERHYKDYYEGAESLLCAVGE